MLPSDTDPAQIEHAALQSEINRLYTAGELRVQDTLGLPNTPEGQASGIAPGVNQNWSVESFRDFIIKNRAVNPQFLGGVPTGYQNVVQMANEAIGGAEGFSPKAYHGIFSPLRRKGDASVREGEFVEGKTTDEVSIAYGWNLSAHPESRSLFKSMFGMNDAQVTDVFNGKAGLTKEQGAALRNHAILQFNDGISKQLPGVALRDNERAALISLAYNMGLGGLKKSGIPDLIRSGATPQAVASKIAGLYRQDQAALKNRREHEAALYLGAKSADFFAKVDTNQLASM